ncbi:unnamed protein product [Meloidogyne enterolobii]|uniref:Uncharacterized protein n=1 Tax=Meloidogyne enterolobii TaxID=390850 RepID=A0ACB0YBL7_MELEN
MILELNTDYPNIRQYLDWNIPDEHINRSKQIPSIFHQNLKENLYPIWPIITPGFPTQNSNFNMNISTAKIIQKTMRNGLWEFNSILNEIEGIKNGIIIPVPFETLWQNWFEGRLFENKYHNYLAIICRYSPKSKYGSLFCDYVGTRIRLQLLFSIEILQNIEYCHINPKKLLNNQKCSDQFKSENDDWICNVWIVGIVFKNNDENNYLIFENEGKEKLFEFSYRIKYGKNIIKSEWVNEIKLFDLNVIKYI